MYIKKINLISVYTKKEAIADNGVEKTNLIKMFWLFIAEMFFIRKANKI